jgi:hypothetical protein
VGIDVLRVADTQEIRQRFTAEVHSAYTTAPSGRRNYKWENQGKRVESIKLNKMQEV